MTDGSDTNAAGVAVRVEVRVALDERGDGRGPTMLVSLDEPGKEVDVKPDFLRKENQLRST